MYTRKKLKSQIPEIKRELKAVSVSTGTETGEPREGEKKGVGRKEILMAWEVRIPELGDQVFGSLKVGC